tara:strand:- start:863 stop:1705 length:843 start_codon:yes stop_codon:yes gene_type:complete
MNYNFVLKKAYNFLESFRVKNPILDSELLLSKILNVPRENLLINFKKKINDKEYRKFNNLLKKRASKMPVAYILGYKYFWKSKFLTNNSVLIPRPETELIIEEALKFLQGNSSKKIIDIGTGSGCIIISILKERPKCKGVAIDISKNAIKVAKINAKLQQVDNRIKFINSDVDKYSSDKYDLIVSNPPYIKKIKISRLEEDVRNFEPLIALDGGYNGRSKLEKVINKSSYLLKRNGKLILEISSDQVNFMINRLKENRFYINRISKDLSNKYRCVVCTKQ